MGQSRERDFVSLAVAASMLGVKTDHIKRYAADRLIGTQQLPGVPLRYSRADLLALKDRCTVPAEPAGMVA